VVKSCPGLFSGSAAEVSSSGWTVLMVLVVLLGVLGYITMRHRSDGRGLTFSNAMAILPLDRASCLMCLLSIPGAIVALPGAILSAFSWARDKARGHSGPSYGRLPDSAVDDELDLGEDELMDDEAEELGDGDVYDEERPLGTLPMRTPERTGNEVGDLLGGEFTSPHAVKKGD